MVLIHKTNIVVDEFTYKKDVLSNIMIYFLTHMHSDHYKGLTSHWNAGPLYCSPLTRTLILNEFPDIQDIRTITLNTPTKIYLNEK